MYNIADFLLVQLSLSRFTLIKSARSSHVCLNYISTAQLYQSYYHNIGCHHNISHYWEANLNFFGLFSAEHFWRQFRLAGIFRRIFGRPKICR